MFKFSNVQFREVRCVHWKILFYKPNSMITLHIPALLLLNRFVVLMYKTFQNEYEPTILKLAARHYIVLSLHEIL